MMSTFSRNQHIRTTVSYMVGLGYTGVDGALTPSHEIMGYTGINGAWTPNRYMMEYFILVDVDRSLSSTCWEKIRIINNT